MSQTHTHSLTARFAFMSKSPLFVDYDDFAVWHLEFDKEAISFHIPMFLGVGGGLNLSGFRELSFYGLFGPCLLI